MSLFGTIDAVDIVMGDLADLARARAGAFSGTSRDPEKCLEAELRAADKLPDPDKARFGAAALINFLVAMRGRQA